MSERWQQIKEILQSALERPVDERERFLDKICAEDESLRREVENLLASSENVGSFMERAAIGKVTEMFVSEDKNLQIGERFNHYKILSPLGAGGMGEVYLAEDMKLNRFVALKLLPQSLSADQDANRRLLREAQAAATLDHPHICQIHEIAERDGRSFIVMQFCEGETLAEKLERGNLHLRETLDLAIQIADALANAHSHHIIHRDIKPANIIVNKQGQAKILDFGLAKVITEKPNVENEAKTAQILSTANMIIGTAPYMSPEQMRGKPLDARTDIFSFGIVLYEMLSGKPLFNRESQAETISAVLNYKPPIAKTLADAPTELQRIVQKTLAKNKDKRYQTAKDLLFDLKSLQKRLEFEAELLREGEKGSRGELEKGRKGEDENFTKIQSSHYLPFSSSPLLNSIAVMPFANLSSDEENEYFCDGLAEELLNALAKIEGLKVAARTSAFSFKGKNANISKVGKTLNVNTVLEGSVRTSGNRLRITVQLVNAADGYHLWSERYDREMQDIFDVQDEITLAVIDTLKVKLLGEEKAAVLKRYTDNTEAYELYLKGCFYRGKGKTESRKKAVEYFQQAIAADPNYAPAYAELSFSYKVLVGSGTLDPREFSPKVEMMARKALELDENLAEAHFAWASFKQDAWQWQAAGMSFKRAVKLNPNLARAHVGYSGHLSRVGRHDEAVAEVKRARELDPLSPIVNANVGFILYFARRYDEAIEMLKATLELDRNFAFAHLYLGYNFAAKREFTEAVSAYQEAIRLGQDTPSNQIYLGAAYAGEGERTRAQTILKQLLNGENYVSPGELAVLYVALDERQQAFASLERAYENHDLQLQYLGVDPAFDPLRDDSRFQDLLRGVGFPQ